MIARLVPGWRPPVRTLLETGCTGRVTAGRGTGRAVTVSLLLVRRGLVISNADLQGLVIVSPQLDRPDIVVPGLAALGTLATLAPLPSYPSQPHKWIKYLATLS